MLPQLEGDGELVPLDASTAAAPSWRRTWPVALASSLLSRFSGKHALAEDALATGDGADELETESDAPSGDSTPSGGKALPASKAGGSRRRKAARK